MVSEYSSPGRKTSEAGLYCTQFLQIEDNNNNNFRYYFNFYKFSKFIQFDSEQFRCQFSSFVTARNITKWCRFSMLYKIRKFNTHTTFEIFTCNCNFSLFYTVRVTYLGISVETTKINSTGRQHARHWHQHILNLCLNKREKSPSF